MPAQSPTLSPTLSAITAGLRGSSSGMPASILPTMSAPTSAALVKMPPPRRANTEMSEPPKPESDERVDRILLLDAREQQHAVVAGHAEQRQARHEHAGDGAALERHVERLAHAAAGRLGDARIGANRHVHADKTGGAREGAADRKADCGLDVERDRQQDRQHHGHDADDLVLPGQVGRQRPPGPPRRSPASARCPAIWPAANGWWRGHRAPRRLRRPAPRRFHSRSRSQSRGIDLRISVRFGRKARRPRRRSLRC